MCRYLSRALSRIYTVHSLPFDRKPFAIGHAMYVTDQYLLWNGCYIFSIIPCVCCSYHVLQCIIYVELFYVSQGKYKCAMIRIEIKAIVVTNN